MKGILATQKVIKSQVGFVKGILAFFFIIQKTL